MYRPIFLSSSVIFGGAASGSGSQEGRNPSISVTCTKLSPNVLGMFGFTSAITVFAE